MSRTIDVRYIDPLDEIWIAAARAIGLRVERTADSYASTDGAGRLLLSNETDLDPDDCLAQMILHELCHFLIGGSESFNWVDWGLDNQGHRDDVLEHACLRLQAALLTPLGLRWVLAPTTDFRPYYEALLADPFAEQNEHERESIVRARAGFARRQRKPWGPHLERALEATQQLVAIAAPYAPSHSLLSRAEEPHPLHPVGFPIHPELVRSGSPEADRTTQHSSCVAHARKTESGKTAHFRCGHCAWAYRGGRGPPVWRCRQAGGSRIDPDSTACDRFERQLDCLTCGACCREAYDTVEVGERDPAKKKHLPLMVERGGGLDMARVGTRCICLQGGIELEPPQPAEVGPAARNPHSDPSPPLAMPGGAPFTCSIYSERPRTCRDFTLGSEHCLSARQVVGLSR